MSKEINATDSAVELAEANDIDLSEVKGTGDEGRILKKDVEELLDEDKPQKAETLGLSTSFRIRTKEGDRLQYVFNGQGKTLKEAIESLTCIAPLEEEGKDFPDGINLLVNVTVKKGDHTFSRALAPHVARATLSKRQNMEYLEKLLGLR